MSESEELSDMNDLRKQTKRNRDRALRDQFAMAALPYAQKLSMDSAKASGDAVDASPWLVAASAYEYADAMMAARGDD